MGKTKTAFVGGVTEEKISSEEKYKKKQAKKKAEAAVAEKLKDKKTKSFDDTQDKNVEQVEKVDLGESFGDAQDRQEEKGITQKTEKIKKVKEEVTPSIETPREQTDGTSAPEELPVSVKKEKKIHVRGKKYMNAKAKTDITKFYILSDAIKLIKSLSYAKFDETYELHMIIKKQGFNLNLTLPHSFGKSKKVEVASDKTLDKLKSGKIDFDILLATPEMMPKLVMYAKLLGPRGLMPNPKNGTLIKNEKEAVKFSVDQKTIKTEKEQPVIHTAVGKMSMNEKDVAENIQVIIDAVTKTQIVKTYLKSTMSPSIKLQI